MPFRCTEGSFLSLLESSPVSSGGSLIVPSGRLFPDRLVAVIDRFLPKPGTNTAVPNRERVFDRTLEVANRTLPVLSPGTSAPLRRLTRGVARPDQDRTSSPIVAHPVPLHIFVKTSSLSELITLVKPPAHLWRTSTLSATWGINAATGRHNGVACPPTRCDRAAAALQSGSPNCAVSVRQLIFLLNRESDGSFSRQRRRGQTEPRTGNQPPIPGDHLTLAAQYYERTRSVFDQAHGPA
jgi:hypothetical protein